MKTTLKARERAGQGRAAYNHGHRRGFTLIELLVVIGVIAILMSILIPALQRAKEQARRVLCGTGLHHVGTGLQLYANHYSDSLPLNFYDWWLWDVSYTTTDFLLDNGCDKKALYCPSQHVLRNGDNAIWWQFSQHPSSPDDWKTEPTNPVQRRLHFRVTGYFWLLDTAEGREYPLEFRPPRPASDTHPSGGKWARKMGMEFAEEIELVVDAVMQSPTTQRFTYVIGDEQNRTSHIDGEDPVGGNILFMDSHVVWRDFSEMEIGYDRTAQGGGNYPIAWW